MTRKKAKHFVSDAEFAARSVELIPILAELGPLGDAEAAEALNAREIKTLGDGKRGWQGTQVARIRRRLAEQIAAAHPKAAGVRRYKAIRADLIKLFGREPAPPRDDHFAEGAIWAGFTLDRYNEIHRRRANLIRFNRAHGHPLDYAGDGQPPIAALPADVWRQYKRDIALLTVAIELCQIASDAFAIAAQKSLLWEILQTGRGIATEIELAQKPAIVADSATAGTA